MLSDRSFQLLEVVTSRMDSSPAVGRRNWPDETKTRIVEEALAPDVNVSAVARRYGMSPSQLFGWRRRANCRTAELVSRYISGGGLCAIFGPLTYSAGSWERMDWASFDIAGVNLYRDQRNRANYREILRGHLSHGKPLVITEFGCSTFEGASQYGAGGFQIVDNDPAAMTFWWRSLNLYTRYYSWVS